MHLITCCSQLCLPNGIADKDNEMHTPSYSLGTTKMYEWIDRFSSCFQSNSLFWKCRVRFIDQIKLFCKTDNFYSNSLVVHCLRLCYRKDYAFLQDSVCLDFNLFRSFTNNGYFGVSILLYMLTIHNEKVGSAVILLDRCLPWSPSGLIAQNSTLPAPSILFPLNSICKFAKIIEKLISIIM